jgi:hypothetical protein
LTSFFLAFYLDSPPELELISDYLEDIKRFLNDPDDARYNDLSDNAYVELAACTFMYRSWNCNIDEYDANDFAVDDITSGLEFHLDDCGKGRYD